jgi:signal peptidase
MSDGADADGETTSLGDHLTVRRTVGVVALLVLVALVLPFVIYSVPQVVGAEHSYVVLSGSMAPTIGAGDVILVDSVDAAAISEGDIVTFRAESASRPTTHRVIDVRDQGGQLRFQTKGDANENADAELVEASELQGRVMSLGGAPIVFPMLGHVIQFAGTDIGFATLFALPLVLFVAFEIRDVLADSSPDSGAETDGEGADDAAAPAVADGSGADAAGGADPDGDGALTFRAAELKLGLVVLGLFTAYGLWVAYVTREIWSVAVLGMVGTTFVLLLGLYLSGSEPAGSTASTSNPSGPGDGASVDDGETAGSTSSTDAETAPDDQGSDSEASTRDATASPATGPAPTADTDADTSRGESDD